MRINTQSFHWQRFFWEFINWFYPPVCCSCGKIGSLLCDDCFTQIKKQRSDGCPKCGEPNSRGNICARCRRNTPHYSTLKSVGYYSGPLRSAVVSLKYQRNLGLGDFFSSPLSQIVIFQGWKIDLITAIPLNPERKRERGYNQAEILARPLASLLNLPFSNQLVIRKKQTASQVGLNLKDRQENMRDAFEADCRKVMGKTILIVDDVTTTGSTMDACSKALKIAGCKEVFGLTLAKTVGLQDDVLAIKNSIFRR
jgi:competence protein ComFC